MDARSALGALAVAAIVAGNYWLGSSGGEQPRRAWGALNTSELRHDVRPIPRVSLAQLLEAGGGAFTEPSEPAIITDLLAGGDGGAGVGAPRWASAAEAARALTTAALPNATVEYYADGMDAYHLLRRAVRLPLGEALGAMDALAASAAAGGEGSGDGPGAPRPYAHWNVGAAQWGALTSALLPGVLDRLPPALRYTDVWLREVLGGGDDSGGAPSLADEWLAVTHWRMVLLGGPGAGMFNHRDALAAGSWQLQLAGAKAWHLCPPSASPAVAAEDPLTGAHHAHVGLDMLRPGRGRGQAGTYALHPRAVGAAGCVLCVVGPGEAIVYPAGWWHQTENVAAPTTGGAGGLEAAAGEGGDEFAPPAAVGGGSGLAGVAITESVVTPSGWRALAAGVAANCAKPHRPGVTPSPALCARLPALMAHWEARFAPAQAPAGEGGASPAPGDTAAARGGGAAGEL